MAKRKREEKLKKAAQSVKNNAYSIKKGVDQYTKESIVDKKTGEVLEDTKKLRSVDLEKAEQDALYGSLFCIITSELGYDERKMRQVLKGGIVHLDDVGGAIAYKKFRNKKGKLVDTLTYSDEDEIALDYRTIQDLYGTDCYNVFLRQEKFNKFLKNISL